MKIPISKYKTWFFDCDGVLLDSNNLKAEAFYESVLPYGKEKASVFREFHKANGGISRYVKFNHFFSRILDMDSFSHELEECLKRYETIVLQGMLECPLTPGAEDLLGRIPAEARKYVVSGGKQTELREIFRKRGIDSHFDGIYGSPDNKEEIIQGLQREGNAPHPSVFIGDARYDCEVALRNSVDIIFMSMFTDFSDWEKFCLQNAIQTIPTLSDIELTA